MSIPSSSIPVNSVTRIKINENHTPYISANANEKVQSDIASSGINLEHSSPMVNDHVKEEELIKEQTEHDCISSIAKPMVELSIPDSSDEQSELSDDLLASYQSLDHDGDEAKTESMSAAAVSKSISLSQSFSSFSDLDAGHHSNSSSSASSDTSSFASIT